MAPMIMPFDDRVGVALQQAAVHVGPGVALVRVADHVAVACMPAAGLPFDAGGKTAAARGLSGPSS